MNNLSIIFMFFLIIFFSCEKNNFENNSGTFKDKRDNQIYSWIKIGNQIWMSENLNYYLTNGCWICDEIDNYSKKYGKLYNWETACDVCPKDWHLPTDEEWFEMIENIGGIDSASYRLKINDISLWGDDLEHNNISGFSAKPGGLRTDACGSVGHSACFWTSTVKNSTNYSGAWSWCINKEYSHMIHDNLSTRYGLSVRCIKD